MGKLYPVAIARGDEYQATIKALTLIRDELKEVLRQKNPSRILLKPNLVSFGENGLPATSPSTIRATIDFLNNFGNFSYDLAESSAFGEDTEEVFRQTSIYQLAREYNNLEIVNLDKERQVPFLRIKTVFGETLVGMAEPVLKAQFLVSLAKLKTHDFLLNTLSIKNLVMGAVSKPDKVLMHGLRNIGKRDSSNDRLRHWHLQEILPFMHFNLLQGAKTVCPDLAIIEGVKAMEKDGPIGGKVVKLGVVIASTDSLSADLVATKIMGFRVSQIPYLYFLKKEKKPKIEIRGESLLQVKRKFAPHRDYPWLLTEKEKVEQLLK